MVPQIFGLALVLCLLMPSLARPDVFDDHHKMMVKAINDDDLARVRALLRTPYIDINQGRYEVRYVTLAAQGNKAAIFRLLEKEEKADLDYNDRGNTVWMVILTGSKKDFETQVMSMWETALDAGGFPRPIFYWREGEDYKGNIFSLFGSVCASSGSDFALKVMDAFFKR